MTVLITLTTAGADTGPFDLYSDADGYVSAFETGVSKAALQAGYSSSLVPNTATIIRVKSTGVCTNYIDISLSTTTTSTSSTTSTTTIAPPTTTTTTTVACACYYYDVEITQTDIDNATGNTDPARNGVVFVTYRKCDDSGSETIIYNVASYYGNAFCQNGNPMYSPIIDVWQNNVQISYTSTATNTGNCCSSPTTTTTTTLVPPTTTTTTTSVSCTIWENQSGISAYYDYTDCNGTEWLNKEILDGNTICAQNGTVSFISGGTLTNTMMACVS